MPATPDKTDEQKDAETAADEAAPMVSNIPQPEKVEVPTPEEQAAKRKEREDADAKAVADADAKRRAEDTTVDWSQYPNN